MTYSLLAVASANDRIALVIGNSDYPSSPLRNPVNDANDIAERFRQLGFKVIHYENTTYLEMENAVREFGNLLDEIKGIGIFFYAGHGLQVKGRNYLMPVDADIQDETEVKHKALDVDFVLGKMELAQNSVNLLILDACRNNPFERSFRSVASRGLAPMNAPSGTVIWYATRPGKVASDGQGRNSPFTRNLLDTLSKRNVEARKVISQIAVSMRDEKLKQEPWQEGIWLEDFYFMKGDTSLSANESTATKSTVDEEFAKAKAEKLHWDIIKDLDQVGAYEEYLSKCGVEFTCQHKLEAYQKLAKLNQQKKQVIKEETKTKKIDKPVDEVVGKKDAVSAPIYTLAKLSIDDIYDRELKSASTTVTFKDEIAIKDTLDGYWRCKWKDSGNRVLEKIVGLEINRISNNSFKGSQSMASPFCTQKWRVKGKISDSKISYKLLPTTASGSASCKPIRTYTGNVYEVNSGSVFMEFNFFSTLSQDRGLMRCIKSN